MECSKNAIIRVNGKYVIWGNVSTGKWIRISINLHNRFKEIIEGSGMEAAYRNKETKKLAKILNELGMFEQDNRKEEIKAATFAITNRCNLSCLHCGFSAKPDNSSELDKNIIISAIDQLENLECLAITGGEPLVHKDFKEIVRFIGKNVTAKKTLMTNAVLINKSNVNLIISNFDNIAISLDAAHEDTCTKIRGTGVFKNVIRNIKLIQSYGFENISLSFTETALNHTEKDDFLTLCDELGVKHVIRGFFNTGRGSENEDKLLLRKPTWVDKKFQVDIAEYRKHQMILTKCKAAINSIYIHFSGDVFPCPVSSDDVNLRMGNIYDTPNIKLLNFPS